MSNDQVPKNDQGSMTKGFPTSALLWSLDIEHSLVIGTWSLVIPFDASSEAVQDLQRLFGVRHAQDQQPLFGIGRSGAISVFNIHFRARQLVGDGGEAAGFVVAFDHQ